MSVSNPLISVVMPVYNAASSIRAAVGSILNQSERDLEIIVVFDASSDGTDEILRQMGREDERIQLIRNDIRDAMPKIAALNLGLKHARGAFIARMDADDIAMTERLELQHRFLLDNPSVGICGTGMIAVDAEGRQIEWMAPVIGPDRVRLMAHYSTPLFHPTWLMRREVLSAVDGYRNMYAEDYDFLLRAMDLGFVLDNCPIYAVRYLRRPDHRALLNGHKAAGYAWRMHLQRVRDGKDRFSKEEHDALVMRNRASPSERVGQYLLTKGFAQADAGNPVSKLLIVLSLLFLPESRRLACRKALSHLRISLYNLMNGRAGAVVRP